MKAFFPNEVCKRGYILLMELFANNALTPIEKAVSIINTIIPVRKAVPVQLFIKELSLIKKLSQQQQVLTNSRMYQAAQPQQS